MKKLPVGFVSPIILLAVGLIVGIGVTFAYFQFKSKPTPQPQQPTVIQSTPTDLSSETQVLEDETANWKTYTNNKYNFTLKVPSNFNLENENNTLDTATEATTLRSVDFNEDKESCRGGCAPPVIKGWQLTISVQRNWSRGYDLPFFRISPPLIVQKEKDVTYNGIRFFITDRSGTNAPENVNYEIHA